MRFEPVGIVSVPRHIFAVGIALLEQHMHDRTGERAIGAGQWHQMQVGCFGARGAVGVDHDQLRIPFAPCRRDMGHHIDLGRDRIAAPNDNQIGFGHLAAVNPAQHPDAGAPTGAGQHAANRQILARIAHRVT